MTTLATKTVSKKYQRKLFAKVEAVFDALDDASGVLGTADAIDNESFDAGITRPKNEDNSNTGTAGRPKPTEGRDEGSWSYGVATRMSGTAGTPPQEHEFLFALFGAYVNSPATSDTYSFDSETPRCLSIIEDEGDVSQIHTGALINSGKLSFDGSGNIMWEFEGKHASTVLAGTDALNGAIDDTVTTLTVDNAKKFDVGTRITVTGTEIMLVTAVPSAATLTVTRGYSGTANVAHLDNAIVTGLKPSHALSGAKIVRPIALTLDDGDGAVSIEIIEGSVNIDKQLKEFNDEATTLRMTGGVYDVKKVSLEIQMRLYRNQLFLLNSINLNKSFAAVLTIGNMAGRIMTVTLPTLVGLHVPIEEGDVEIVVTRTFEAFENAGDDEATVVFT